MRTKAFIERFRLKADNVEKQPDWDFAVVALSSTEHVEEAANLLSAQVVDGKSAVKLHRGIVLAKPGACWRPGRDVILWISGQIKTAGMTTRPRALL